MSISDFLTPNEVRPVFDNDSPDWTLPNGEEIRGWVGTENLCRRSNYLWFETDDVPGVQRGSVEYRVFPFEQPGGDWLPLGSGDGIAPRTADDYEEPGSDGAELGTKFKLPVGRYSFEFRIRYEGQPLELRGGHFRLYRHEAESLEASAELVRLFRALPKED